MTISLAKRHEAERERGSEIASAPEAFWGQAKSAGAVRVARRKRMIVNVVGMTNPMHVLEVGCGTGNFTEEFAKTGAHIIANDISGDLLARAREKVPNVQFLCTPAESLDEIPDGSMDAIVGHGILHHLEVPIALKTFHRILRPGGMMCFIEPNMLNPQNALQKNIPMLKKLMGETPNETAFIRFRLMKQFTSAGFQETHMTPFDFLHPWTPAPLVPIVDHLGRVLERIPLIREFAGSLLITARKNCFL